MSEDTLWLWGQFGIRRLESKTCGVNNRVWCPLEFPSVKSIRKLRYIKKQKEAANNLGISPLDTLAPDKKPGPALSLSGDMH